MSSNSELAWAKPRVVAVLTAVDDPAWSGPLASYTTADPRWIGVFSSA